MIDFSAFCRDRLRIRSKMGDDIPFVLTEHQLRLHNALEAQRAETGQVRALIIKHRQTGCSTYLLARLFWRMANDPSLPGRSIVPNQATANNFRAIVGRYERQYGAHGMDYAVEDFTWLSGVASLDAVKLLHCSEIAYWGRPEFWVEAILEKSRRDTGAEFIMETSTETITGDDSGFCGRLSAAGIQIPTLHVP